MPDTPPATETKSVLEPKAVVDLLFQARNGTVMSVPDDFDLASLLSAIGFPADKATGKQAKIEFAGQGGLIVQRSVIVVRSNVAEVLLSQRSSDHHAVTTEGSILVSGSPTLPPEQVLANKVQLEPAPPPEAFQRIGIGFNTTQDGIRYAFEVWVLQADANAKATALTKDAVQFVSMDQARQALAGKPMELYLIPEYPAQ